jgi:photosystem I subunit 10
MASQLSAAASMSAAAAAVPRFHGCASLRSAAALPLARAGGRKRAQGIRCDYIGSATNQVVKILYRRRSISIDDDPEPSLPFTNR